MTASPRYLQFQSPFQGLAGFDRFMLDAESGLLSRIKPAKPRKLIKKGVKKIDGLVLNPVWATRTGLAVTTQDDQLQFTQITKGRVGENALSISSSDASFQVKISERLLYRTFTISNANAEMKFRDFSARLVSPRRTSHEIFPTNDFSSFARLFAILSDEDATAKLINELNNHRFDYPYWIDRANVS